MAGVIAALVFSALVLAGIPVQAIAQNRPAERVALLIGNWDYNGNGRFDDDHEPGYASDLHSPCNDIEHIGKPLRSSGFRVLTLCNQTRAGWVADVEKFAAETAGLADGSIIFVYFSGHGIQHNGFPFTIPVGFKLDIEVWSAKSEKDKVEELRSRGNDLTRALRVLTNNPKVALVVAVDACRDTPAGSDEAYNQAVSILVPYNAIIQYATTPGQRLPDTADGVSGYATILAAELARGGDIGNVMTRVANRIWSSFLRDSRSTYADMNTGPAFLALPPTSIRGTAVAGPAQPQPGVSKRLQSIRKTEDGMRLDVFWCDGAQEKLRFDYAMQFARAVAGRAGEFGVGRVQVKVLPGSLQSQGYNVRRNLMRYDPVDVRERNLLIRLSSAFPEGNFLPQQGAGVGGNPTRNYVSAFVCGPMDQ